MADEDTGQERTEEATPRRLERAREEGQVARSRELNTAAILLAGSGALLAFGPAVVSHMLAVARANFGLERAAMFDPSAMFAHAEAAANESLNALIPFFLLLVVAALAAPSALGGWLFSAKTLTPQFNRLDPIAGIQRMFSMRALVELLKAVAKFLVVAGIAVLLLYNLEDELFSLGSEQLAPALHHAVKIIGWSALALSASTLLIAAVDVPYQLFDHAKKLRMTTQQVRDEMKDTEGKPEIKNRIRQLQRQMARNRMMAAVPKADVVITNPTHYAVALRYDIERAGAPLLVAKGSDLIALKIREIAEANGVPVVESPRLARAIYFTTELETQIAAGLFMAVAQVLAYVFHMRSYRGSGPAPKLPDELPIPEGMDQRQGGVPT